MTQPSASTPKPPAAKPGRPGGPRRPVFVAGNLVVLGWLAVAVGLLLSYDTLGRSVWLPIHALLLGAATNAIVIWSEHFVSTLCRAPDPPSWRLGVKLVALNVAAVAALTGVFAGIDVLTGVSGVAVAVIAIGHGVQLVAMKRGALKARFDYLVGFYVAAGAALLVGAAAGAILGLGADGWYARVWAVHVHVMLLGWIGLTVVGTLFTLWPVASGVRITDRTFALARRTLPTLIVGLVVVTAGLLADSVWVSVAGLLCYVAGVGMAVVALWPTRKPREVGAWMLAAATAWLGVAVLVEVIAAVTARSVHDLPAVIESTAIPILAVGFVAQILIGALTQLLPVVVSRGPAQSKAVVGYLAQGWLLRVLAINLAVPLVAPPWPGPVRLSGWALAAVAVVSFLWMALRLAIPAAFRGAINVDSIGRRVPGTVTGVVAAVVAVALVAALRAAVLQNTSTTTISGQAKIVDVALHDMRVWPDTLEVTVGTRLVLRVTNQESLPHDLRLDTGEHTPRLARNQTALLDVGVVQQDREVWCDVPGHRASGMTMTIRALGAQRHNHGSTEQPGGTGTPPTLNLAAAPSPGWTARDATLPPAAPGTHRVEMHAADRELEVAPGRRETRWTWSGSEPGPILHGRVGDQFEITVVNDTTMGHGIDFHAGALAPDQPMRTIAPGERLVYRFTARRSGAWLYHCSTPPMSLHIADGMYGAVIIDPPGLPAVDREFVLVGAQLYLGDPDSKVEAVRAGQPDGWMYNGMAAQYQHAPLPARRGERVRIWVVNAGPGDTIAFHIVGAQFDTVYKEGAWLLRPGTGDATGGSQALDLAPAQGGFVELSFPEPGHYMFMDHDLRHAENGASGIFVVS